MNVLVTGGTGFAGRYVCRYFIQHGHSVSATYRRDKIPAFLEDKVHYIRQELSEEITIDGQFDAIIHTACSHSGKVLSMEEYVRDNVDSARQILKYAREKGIDTIIYFSTRSVYGDIKEYEVDETTGINNPSGYGVTKYIAEQIFNDAKDIKTLGFRLPGIIGPGAHNIWLVDIVKKIMDDCDVEISDFDTVNLASIDDISRFIEKMILHAKNGGSFKYSIVNLACSKSVNNLEIAELIKKRFGSKSKIITKKPVLASPDVQGGLFVLKTNRAVEMGFESSAPLDIVNDYLNTQVVKGL